MLNLEEIKNKLIKEKKEIESMFEEIKSEFEDIVKERVMSTDEMADQYETKLEIYLQKDSFLQRLKLIDRALHKIDEGTYGKCDKCGLNIEQSRLDIDCAVNLCRQCSLG